MMKIQQVGVMGEADRQMQIRNEMIIKGDVLQ